MISESLMLILVLLATGAATLIYWLRKHVGVSPNAAATKSGHTANRGDHTAAMVEDKQEAPSRADVGDVAGRAATLQDAQIETGEEGATQAPSDTAATADSGSEAQQDSFQGKVETSQKSLGDAYEQSHATAPVRIAGSAPGVEAPENSESKTEVHIESQYHHAGGDGPAAESSTEALAPASPDGEEHGPSSQEEEPRRSAPSNLLSPGTSEAPATDEMESGSSEHEQSPGVPEDLATTTDQEDASSETASVHAGGGVVPDSRPDISEVTRVYSEVVRVTSGKPETGDDVAPEEAQLPEGRVGRGPKKTPGKYKGLDRTAPQPQDTDRQEVGGEGGELTKRDRSLPIEVRLRFDRGGFCSVSFIAKRSAGLPEGMTVAAQAGEVELRAMQDEWYQDVVPDDISCLLRDGTVWTQEGANGKCRWSLSGRALYVLADRSDISGYVSQTCLDLGRVHAVLCSEPIRSRVEEAIQKTRAEPTTVLDESLGAPPGWIVFQGVVPKAPVAPVGEADIFNALRPLPRIKISLERGIRLEYANWLEGHAPSIRVYGDAEHTAEVRIDGQVAACGEDGTYRAPGWDLIGSHSVWCSGMSKSYSIVPFTASWEHWDAYAFPVTYGSQRSIAICGPLVRCVSDAPQSQAFSVSVPESNPVLVGQAPGQHALAVSVSGVRGIPRIASPLFCPVWALPRDPLRCDKKTAYILLIGAMAAPDAKRENLQGKGAGSDRDVDAWCRLILDANRKGLKTQPHTEAVRDLWLSYKRLARRIWRARK